MSRSRSKDLSSSDEGIGAGVVLGRDAVLELVNKLGEDVEVEEEVDTVMVVLVTTFGAAKGKEVNVVEVDRVAVDSFSKLFVSPKEQGIEEVVSISKEFDRPRELELIVEGPDLARDKCSLLDRLL